MRKRIKELHGGESKMTYNNSMIPGNCVWTFLSKNLTEKEFVALVFENKLERAISIIRKDYRYQRHIGSSNSYTEYIRELETIGAKESLKQHANFNCNDFAIIQKSPELIFLLKLSKIKI